MRTAESLGWFSIGLGLLELAAPRTLAKFIGVEPRSALFRGLGLREIASGLGILTQRNSTAWMRSRVAGDALDLALLVTALLGGKNRGPRLAVTTAAVAGVAALDVVCSRKLSRHPDTDVRTQTLTRVITVNRSPEEVYALWHNFEVLPWFMNHLQQVRIIGEGRSHWVAKGPAGTNVEWDAEITEDQPNERIAWRSLPGSQVSNSGVVEFQRATGGRGTVLRVRIDYAAPGGTLSAWVATLSGEGAEKQVIVDLHRFKQLMETGEIARTEGQSSGRAKSTSSKYDDPVRT